MITNKERQIIKYRPVLSYTPEFLSVVSTDSMVYELSPAIDRFTKKTPSGLLGDLLVNREDAQVILERLKKCVANDDLDVPLNTYIDAISNDAELAYKVENNNAMSINGTSQLECIPLLLDAIQEYDRLAALLSNILNIEADDLDDLEKIERNDHIYIDSIVNKDINGSISNEEKMEIETKVILIEGIDRIANNTKNFVKGLNSVLYSNVNKVYNNAIVDIVQAYGKAPIDVLEVIADMYTIEFKKCAISCNNDKTRMRRLDTLGMKTSIVNTFQKVSTLRDHGVNKVHEWISGIDTDFDRNSLTQIVCDGLDGIEFINNEYEKIKLEYFKQIALDSLVKTDLVTTMQAKKTARQKLNLITDIITEKKNNSFDVTQFVTSRSLTAASTLCTK